MYQLEQYLWVNKLLRHILTIKEHLIYISIPISARKDTIEKICINISNDVAGLGTGVASIALGKSRFDLRELMLSVLGKFLWAVIRFDMARTIFGFLSSKKLPTETSLPVKKPWFFV